MDVLEAQLLLQFESIVQYLYLEIVKIYFIFVALSSQVDMSLIPN